ncbi:MAG: OB-fold nucleic acid binding domain-containing protein, partial [Chitinophagales bacterium]
MSNNLSELEIIRRESLTALRNLGIEPYPAEKFEISFSSKEILDEYPTNNEKFANISFAGRLMGKRIMGKAAFAVLQDNVGKIQIYVKGEEICDGDDKTLYEEVFKKHFDIGDILGVKGYVFTTKTGETTIHVKEIKLLSKSLRPLPIVKTDAEGNIFDAFSDPELRYRQRYVDLIVNPHVKEVFLKRTKMVNTMRNFLTDKGYVEVETPILQPLY